MSFERLNFTPPTGHLEFANPSSTEEARQNLQSLHTQTQDSFNAMQEKLESIDGALTIGAKDTDETQTTVQAKLDDLQANKVDLTGVFYGDFQGTINGVAPTAAEPALSAIVDGHLADTSKHITAEDRTTWNAKQKAITISSTEPENPSFNDIWIQI